MIFRSLRVILRSLTSLQKSSFKSSNYRPFLTTFYPQIIIPLLTLIPHISKGFIQHCGKRLENTNIFNLLFIRVKITIIRGFPQISVRNCGKLHYTLVH